MKVGNSFAKKTKSSKKQNNSILPLALLGCDGLRCALDARSDWYADGEKRLPVAMVAQKQQHDAAQGKGGGAVATDRCFEISFASFFRILECFKMIATDRFKPVLHLRAMHGSHWYDLLPFCGYTPQNRSLEVLHLYT